MFLKRRNLIILHSHHQLVIRPQTIWVTLALQHISNSLTIVLGIFVNLLINKIHHFLVAQFKLFYSFQQLSVLDLVVLTLILNLSPTIQHLNQLLLSPTHMCSILSRLNIQIFHHSMQVIQLLLQLYYMLITLF
jgi:hypothetical protein